VHLKKLRPEGLLGAPAGLWENRPVTLSFISENDVSANGFELRAELRAFLPQFELGWCPSNVHETARLRVGTARDAEALLSAGECSCAL
jgi:hypothetical protein